MIEFVPVTCTVLLEDSAKKLISPRVKNARPPLEMTRLLPLPLLPRRRLLRLVHSEFEPVTSTLLLEEPKL